MSSNPGFLTATDRAFVRDEKTYDSKQGRYQRRASIRERTRGAFHDFARLYEHLEESERETIFEPLTEGTYHPAAVAHRDDDPPAPVQEANQLHGDLIATLGFIYLGVRDTAVPFSELVEAAVFQTERDLLDRFVEVSLTIEDHEPFGAIEHALAKLEAGTIDRLTYTETQVLLEFLVNPDKYPDSDARRDALARLNDLETLTVSPPETSADAK